MDRSCVIAVAMLFVSAPVAAQSSLWSATMTAGEAEFSNGTVVGYWPALDAGELSDSDFVFRGTTHSVIGLFQYTSGSRLGTLRVIFTPAMEDQDLVVRHVTIFGYGHGLQRAIIDESQHRKPECLIMAQH